MWSSHAIRDCIDIWKLSIFLIWSNSLICIYAIAFSLICCSLCVDCRFKNSVEWFWPVKTKVSTLECHGKCLENIVEIVAIKWRSMISVHPVKRWYPFLHMRFFYSNIYSSNVFHVPSASTTCFFSFVDIPHCSGSQHRKYSWQASLWVVLFYIQSILWTIPGISLVKYSDLCRESCIL